VDGRLDFSIASPSKAELYATVLLCDKTLTALPCGCLLAADGAHA
jgi:hypothetical protein